MVTDRQVKRLMKLLSRGKTLAAAAAKADMDENTQFLGLCIKTARRATCLLNVGYQVLTSSLSK